MPLHICDGETTERNIKSIDVCLPRPETILVLLNILFMIPIIKMIVKLTPLQSKLILLLF